MKGSDCMNYLEFRRFMFWVFEKERMNYNAEISV